MKKMMMMAMMSMVMFAAAGNANAFNANANNNVVEQKSKFGYNREKAMEMERHEKNIAMENARHYNEMRRINRYNAKAVDREMRRHDKAIRKENERHYKEMQRIERYSNRHNGSGINRNGFNNYYNNSWRNK